MNFSLCVLPIKGTVSSTRALPVTLTTPSLYSPKSSNRSLSFRESLAVAPSVRSRTKHATHHASHETDRKWTAISIRSDKDKNSKRKRKLPDRSDTNWKSKTAPRRNRSSYLSSPNVKRGRKTVWTAFWIAAPKRTRAGPGRRGGQNEA